MAQGLDIQKLVHGKNKAQYLDTILTAALKLQKMGCRAIAAECGYFAFFQKEVRTRMNIPVFMSSLLQVPWAQSIINPDHVVGILMATKKDLLYRVHPGSNYSGKLLISQKFALLNFQVNNIIPNPVQTLAYPAIL